MKGLINEFEQHYIPTHKNRLEKTIGNTTYRMGFVITHRGGETIIEFQLGIGAFGKGLYTNHVNYISGLGNLNPQVYKGNDIINDSISLKNEIEYYMDNKFDLNTFTEESMDQVIVELTEKYNFKG